MSEKKLVEIDCCAGHKAVVTQIIQRSGSGKILAVYTPPCCPKHMV